MRYFTGVARCRDRKKWDISKIPFASTNNPVERPSNLSAFNRFLLALRIALSVYSSPQANRINREIELYSFLKQDEIFLANISQGKNGKGMVRILLKFWCITNDLQNFADFSKNENETTIY